MERKQTTGRFETREQLIERVLFLYYETSCSMAQIARNCKVSETTIAKILKDIKREVIEQDNA